ncbi:MAG TPA: carbamoyltransferase HypF, partial [Vicinamibacterales bacterium]|nr:carbamoyltransferase HypF [Vicinamibacterales bacterium]
RAEYSDPENRRFHAEPIACPDCGPHYTLSLEDGESMRDHAAIRTAAQLLCDGLIVAVKGIGGYHLACDAENEAAVMRLRDRKFRKEQAFAIMTADLELARRTIDVTPEVEALLTSSARPIVLAPARARLPAVAPDQRDLGVMLPYAPLHHLLFDAGAPSRLVMTSGNRSSEPIAFEDDDALTRLGGIADAFLMGERPIARRVDDSVVRAGALGPIVLRRSRGFAPSAVATLPASTPILAVGGDLKNTVTLVVNGEAFISQHIGDLSHHASLRAFDETVHDLIRMHGLTISDLTVVHDAHPDYKSSEYAAALGGRRTLVVQHHRAHIASVLAERGELERHVIGIACDGTGYGDDGGIWGGEIFAGSVADGFERVAHLRPALLPGGDAAARHPVQAAAGFLAQLGDVGVFTSAPFCFPERYLHARAILRTGVRTFATTSTGRLFDTVAALLGFTRGVTFEGQAAVWLEHLARGAEHDVTRYEIPATDSEIDWRHALSGVVAARAGGISVDVIARAFHRTLACGLASVIDTIVATAGVEAVVLSGGVMQNQLLVADLRDLLADCPYELLVNHRVPANDGGLSLGQAALAAVQTQ